jgi:hypothetical protein
MNAPSRLSMRFEQSIPSRSPHSGAIERQNFRAVFFGFDCLGHFAHIFRQLEIPIFGETVLADLQR